ncbi:tereporin-Ca1-like isoform X2 [Mytilus californianus]|nr:tereporin-Ca1-like isoform X2 [Mytilus californianus]XP_052076296.1 tereporin-Ca1-like isoform X2 [Mytilus californianus]
MASTRLNRFINQNGTEDSKSSDSDETNMGNNSNENKSTGRVTWNSQMMKSMRDSTRLGPSLHGTNLSTMMTNIYYNIVVGIEITNWTRYHLSTRAMMTYSRGYMSTPAVSVRPGHQEALIIHEYGYRTCNTMTGSSGIVSWLIQNKERCLVIFWKVPYFSSNSMGICLKTVGSETDNDCWFSIIRNEQKDEKLKYKFSTFDDTSNEMMIEDDDFQIFGSIETSSKPEVKITLRPTMTQDLHFTGPQ